MSPPAIPPESLETRGHAVTWRGLILGAVMATFVGLGAGYTEMIIRCSPMANDFTASAALYLLAALLLLVHLPLSLVARRFALTRGELATVYVMMLVACGVPTRGFVEFLGPTITGARYYATATNHWGEWFNPVLDTMPWVVPQDRIAIRAYYDGLPEGASIPWGVWLRPAFLWMLFVTAMSMAMVCVVVLLRRQWMRNERLVYPMMQVPLDIIQGSAGERKAGFWSNRLLWIGFAIPFLLLSYKALAHGDYFPELFTRFALRQRVSVIERAISLEFRFSPITLGFMYFVRMDVLMGLWAGSLFISVFFGYLKYAGGLPANIPKIGIWSYDTIRAFTGMGALFVFMGVILYRARKRIWAELRVFWTRDNAEDAGEEEIMSYRVAWVVLVLCVAFMMVWFHETGMAWWQAGTYLFLAFLVFLALTRVVAEAGLPMAMTPACAGDFMVGLFGSTAFTKRNLVGFGLTYPMQSEMRTSVMALCANGLKLFHETVQRRRRWMLWGILAAILLSYSASMLLMIYFPYERGGLNLDRFSFFNTARYPWMDAARRVREPHGPIWEAYTWMGGGAAGMGMLMTASRVFLWWPLHPIGIITSFHWSGRVLFSSALFMWIIKGMVLKYGGPWLFRQIRPFFVGLVLGEVVVAGFWATLDVILGAKGNSITSFF